MCSIQTLEAQLKQFWELETISIKSTYSLEETLCEQHYCNNTKRVPSGRYSVSLPTKSNITELGKSHISARRQFLSLEKRLHRNESTYNQYREFMSDYIALGHMVAAPESSELPTYYLPHHYVLKNTSTTTKLRVVFNASSKTSSQLSLNDCLMVGPTIQQDLFTIILRFRTHIYAFCGDITKMYRQIMVKEDQQELQRIWWRNQITDEIQSFKLCTVTYGTASAPFLATRTLKQLAIDEQAKFHIAAKIASRDFYVDDILTGASTLDQALRLKADLIELLRLGGFELRKFYANNPSLASVEQSTNNVTLILGLSWNTYSDHFEAQLDKLNVGTHCSKRTLLSEISQLFDPLGLCAPIIITAKLIMQSLWLRRDMSWDDILPDKIYKQWNNFKSQLINVTQISIPRCILVSDSRRIELHGFGDASERAFGCVLYIRVTDANDDHHVKLVCAKSRVAPVKTQSIPRLELCAALLLAEVTNKLLNILEISFDSIYLWSDSEITLLRIRSEPHKYATFVANRISKIQEYTASFSWKYVNSASNPADLVSRGLMPSELSNASLWWCGPEFLRHPQSEWPKASNMHLSPEFLSLDTCQPSTIALNQLNPCNQEIFMRFHSYSMLVHVVAYILRFYYKVKKKHNHRTESSINLQLSEIDDAVKKLIHLAQEVEFREEIKCLRTNQAVSNKSSLRSLNPFLDEKGLVRVGGRLGNAPISYDTRHPILLPRNHPLSKMIVRHEHNRLLHAGPQALLYNVRLVYWIIGGRRLCRTIVNLCVRCFHARPCTRNQIMGDLPSDRVTQSARPFVVVGIDFCGPFIVKQAVRSKIMVKCYVCLFICFTTKAVHLEMVMNLSTESFLACLRRFVARRGVCSKIYSDNATNFIGARSELTELKNLFLSQQFQDRIMRHCTAHSIEWCTIPPRSPHFGGLWESAIKSAKHHLKRVIGSSSCTVEEFYTLIAQIEACLNSRPLTALSSDPSDLAVLSPGHFIIGSPLMSLPEPSLVELRTNKLSLFQAIQRNLQVFWNRWQVEYLAELQRRYKWQTVQHKYPIGALVLLHDDNLPPLKWSLGRIVETHPGKDGIIRVVTIKTSQSILKRAVNRISILPTDVNQ